jgi:hypothetical protein
MMNTRSMLLNGDYATTDLELGLHKLDRYYFYEGSKVLSDAIFIVSNGKQIIYYTYSSNIDFQLSSIFQNCGNLYNVKCNNNISSYLWEKTL